MMTSVIRPRVGGQQVSTVLFGSNDVVNYG